MQVESAQTGVSGTWNTDGLPRCQGCTRTSAITDRTAGRKRQARAEQRYCSDWRKRDKRTQVEASDKTLGGK